MENQMSITVFYRGIKSADFFTLEEAKFYVNDVVNTCGYDAFDFTYVINKTEA